MDHSAKLFVAGHRGMVGSAIVRRLRTGGFGNVVTRTRAQLDLLDQRAVNDFLAAEKPDYIVIAAAKVGGIQANDQYRAAYARDKAQKVASGAPALLAQARAMLSAIESRNHA